MKKHQTFITAYFIAIILLFHTFNSFGQADTIRPVHVGLVYPISSNGLRATDYTNRFSLHAIAGLSKNETALSIAGAANIVKQNANGAQIAGAVNLIGNDASGVQIAGFANLVKKNVEGAQIAGFLNMAENAGAVQIAGFSNIVGKNSKGLQLSGFFNKSENVNVQIAGFLNVAKKVKGVQLAGLINIADSSDYPIGIFNFIKSGEKSVSITIDETMTGMASFRSGGRILYGIAGIGYNFKNNERPLYAVEAGLGAHIPVTERFRINLEAVSLTLSDFKKGTYMKSSLRILPAYRVGSRIEIFAGPTINYVNYSKESGKGLVDKYLWSRTRQDDFQGLFAGFTGGVQILL